MRKAWTLALLLCLAAISLAQTQESQTRVDDSGNAFLSLCEDVPDPISKQSVFLQGKCLGYVDGVDEGIGIAYDFIGQPRPYCFPNGVTHGQMIRVLIKFIKGHPDKAHSETRLLEMMAFMDAFPCKDTKK